VTGTRGHGNSRVPAKDVCGSGNEIGDVDVKQTSPKTIDVETERRHEPFSRSIVNF
jgi:hypothetical protein